MSLVVLDELKVAFNGFIKALSMANNGRISGCVITRTDKGYNFRLDVTNNGTMFRNDMVFFDSGDIRIYGEGTSVVYFPTECVGDLVGSFINLKCYVEGLEEPLSSISVNTLSLVDDFSFEKDGDCQEILNINGTRI